MLLVNYLSFISVLIIVFNVNNHYVESAPRPRTLRFCSKSLSDALYLVCKGRGYNEPFSYNDGIDSKRTNSPGLVDECCYHSCSLEQIEQYCKPMIPGDNSNNDGIGESLRIVNLPYSRIPTLIKESTKHKESLKSKKTHRKHDALYRDNDRVNNSLKVIDNHHERINKSVRQQMDMKKSMKTTGNTSIDKLLYVNCKRRRNTRRHCSKANFSASLKKVPNFMIGTILPELSDSMVLFPSKSHQDYWRVTRNLESNSNKLAIPAMKKFLINQDDYKNS